MTPSPTSRNFDIVIVGGGMIGLTLARLLSMRLASRPGGAPAIAVIEANPPPLSLSSSQELDVRVSALSPATLDLLQQAGCLEGVPEAARCSYDSMRVWQDDAGIDGGHAISFSAAELGAAELGQIVENRAVRSALWQAVADAGDVELLMLPAQSLRIDDDGCCIELDGMEIHARLLVGADGANSWLRQQLGIAVRERHYGQNAMVAHLSSERAHDNTAWQKFLPGGPVALLPLADGRSSLVWSHPDAESERLMALDDDEFAALLTAQFDGVLGALHCSTPRACFPLVRSHAAQYTGRRFALLGDAAHRVHPLAGQGANLGMQDVRVLVEELAAHLQHALADPGDPRVLRRYERRRKGENALTMGSMDVLNALFRSPMAATAGFGLGMVEQAAPLKRLLAERAMGAPLHD
jgi:2-octaprenyl-3-methyl-6-methoxy-1,4-benzoquinol hydroxylase/2-octaprenylphenol hydroxylase